MDRHLELNLRLWSVPNEMVSDFAPQHHSPGILYFVYLL